MDWIKIKLNQGCYLVLPENSSYVIEKSQRIFNVQRPQKQFIREDDSEIKQINPKKQSLNLSQI